MEKWKLPCLMRYGSFLRQFKHHVFLCGRMFKFKPVSAESESLCAFLIPVLPVARKRASDMCHLDADLMVPAGV